MIRFPKTLAAWASPEFEPAFKQELCDLGVEYLPLQAGLRQSSYVSDSPLAPVLLQSRETVEALELKAGIFYAGVIAGSCCADDPTPVCDQSEYCELQITINKLNAEASIVLLAN
jgi:hypothetical protein